MQLILQRMPWVHIGLKDILQKIEHGKGTDHAASLEPAGLSKLIRDLDAIHKSMKYKNQDILEIEKPQRDKLKWQK